ncbi:hypothetical protein DPMN_168491 [Dreissena polymorpha]|uniref:Uncharacterized protein n=1 Tax=Dreissena polymorpha TaxID=45954 RepID=A0A9D4IZD4_DREPO|nr:hypothetical protein DPMN_168491 [Dreissena polymorpha]
MPSSDRDSTEVRLSSIGFCEGIKEENASYKHIEKTAPSPGDTVFPLITTIFNLIRHINKTNVLTKFHDDCPKHMTFRCKTWLDGSVTNNEVWRRSTLPTPALSILQITFVHRPLGHGLSGLI